MMRHLLKSLDGRKDGRIGHLMASKFQGFPGMDDILPGEIEKWQWVEEKARIFMEAGGFREIRTPILEPTELFIRSIGQSSDIVHKEMFSFKDRGERDMTMRPEMTASVARAVLEKGLLTQAKSLRLYYMGPMFRAERPQAGRKRQFHQIGAEIINEGREADFESIALLHGFLQYAGLKEFALHVNDLGGEEDRDRVRVALVKYFGREKEKLCKDCQWRLEKNVLRIFDCKIPSCQPVIEKAPWEEFAPLSAGFQALIQKLAEREIACTVNRRLVRGLDYYNGVVFEVTAGGLGAQNAVAGGGRYDCLYQDLGGAKTPCTGFSIGVERLISAVESRNGPHFASLREKTVYLAPLEDDAAIAKVIRNTALGLRERGFRIETTHGVFSLSQHLKRADKVKARYAVIAGTDEVAKGVLIVKDLANRTQQEVRMDEIVSFLSLSSAAGSRS